MYTSVPGSSPPLQQMDYVDMRWSDDMHSTRPGVRLQAEE
jgi:hypothetical protein